MRILILSMPRTGSTSLLSFVAQSLDYKEILEPLNEAFIPNYTSKEIWEDDNVVVKFLEHQVVGTYEDLIQKFDKTIILTRRNLEEQTESMSNLFYRKRQNKEDYHTYVYNREQILKDEYDYANSFIVSGTKKLLSIKGFHICYEDIYINRSRINELKNFLDIKTDKADWLLNVSRKYRIPNYKNIL